MCECLCVGEELAGAAAVLAAAAARPGFARSDEELTSTLVDAYALVSQGMALVGALARDAAVRDLPDRVGSNGTVSWLRETLRITPAEARRLVSLGELLDARPVLSAAIADGEVNAGQVTVIGRVLADVPDKDPTIVDKVEAELLRQAAKFDPADLRTIGDRALAHVNPELADETLRYTLEREQRHARLRRGFTLSPDGYGGVRVRGVLDVEAAATVGAALDPLARPTRGVDGPDPRTAAARRADALVDVCHIALAAGGLPDNGGTPPQLTITVDFESLRRQLAVGQLDTGGQLTPDTVRRLACGAGILPVVLDGAGVPLDVGRTRRTYTGAARQAVLARDGGCAFPGCDRPPRWTDVHHIVAWIDGGATDLDNAVALCGHHHRLVHHSGWEVRLGPDRRPEFIPPAHIGPSRQPRRNPYHQRN